MEVQFAKQSLNFYERIKAATRGKSENQVEVNSGGTYSRIRNSLCTVERGVLDLTYYCSKMRFMGISGNHWQDKKPVTMNWIEVRVKFKVNAGFHLAAIVGDVCNRTEWKSTTQESRRLV
nr:hypothetical protein [Tanacetum cinerariifolium]